MLKFLQLELIVYIEQKLFKMYLLIINQVNGFILSSHLSLSSKCLINQIKPEKVGFFFFLKIRVIPKDESIF